MLAIQCLCIVQKEIGFTLPDTLLTLESFLLDPQSANQF